MFYHWEYFALFLLSRTKMLQHHKKTWQWEKIQCWDTWRHSKLVFLYLLLYKTYNLVDVMLCRVVILRHFLNRWFLFWFFSHRLSKHGWVFRVWFYFLYLYCSCVTTCCIDHVAHVTAYPMMVTRVWSLPRFAWAMENIAMIQFQTWLSRVHNVFTAIIALLERGNNN